MPPGSTQRLALAFARPLAAVSSLLQLDRPDRAIASLRDPSAPRRSSEGKSLSTTTRTSGVSAGTGVAPGTDASVGSAASSSTTSTTTSTTTAPVYSVDNPVRVWVGGDSMVEQVGDSLINMAQSLGYIEANMDFKINSGLCRPDYFDWPALMREVAEDSQPQLAVLMFGGNDMQAINEGGESLVPWTDSWTQAYAKRVKQSIDTFLERGTHVYWLGAPIMRSEQDSTWASDLNAIYSQVCSEYPADQVRYIDCWDLFTGPDGAYSAYLDDSSGKTWQVREPDGIHFTLAGGDWVATEILERLREDFTISKP